MAGVKPSMAGDIWSHGGCSLMGICFYGINDYWKMDEWLVAATPFGSTRHTGEAIDEISAAALRRQGVQWRENGTVYEAVHAEVSDHASNMAKGWRGFDGGFCADHTLELSVHKYTGETTVARTFSKCKGIVAYFHRSTAGIQDLTKIQESNGLPLKQPVSDVVTRWFSSYEMMDWFREQKTAVQMYDIKHGADAAKNANGDAYKANRLQHIDWDIVEQSVAVLLPSAQATKHLEGTMYVTSSLVLPYVYRLIEGTADGMLYLPWKAQGSQWLRAEQLNPAVRAARRLLHDDLEARWLTGLPEDQRTELEICTLLDPRFKTYEFPGITTDLSLEKRSALASLEGAWKADYKPNLAAAARAPAPAPAPVAPAPPKIAKTSTSSSIFAIPLAPPEEAAPPAAAPAAAAQLTDDLEKYLALPAETNFDLDVLAWWKARDHSMPADPAKGQPEGCSPHLAKMARQFLGRPATSAGVERMFSKAGKLHDDMTTRLSTRCSLRPTASRAASVQPRLCRMWHVSSVSAVACVYGLDFVRVPHCFGVCT